jgi:hypothetical protein
MQYNRKLHETKNWQEIGCNFVSFSTFVGSFFLPIKSGEIPIARIVALVTSGTALATSAMINHSKKDLDLQWLVIQDGKTQVFLHEQSMETALQRELVDTQVDAKLAKKMGVSVDELN